MSKELVQAEVTKFLDRFVPEVNSVLQRIFKENTDYSIADIIKVSCNSFADAVLQSLQETISPDIVLPNNTKYVHRTSTNLIFVVEQPPGVRNLYFDEVLFQTHRTNSFSSNSRRVAVALPYSIFLIHYRLVDGVFRINKIYFVYAKTPMTNLEHLIYRPNLPNIDANGYVCMGDIHIPNHGLDFSAHVAKVIDSFWKAKFTSEIDEAFWSPVDDNFLGGLDLPSIVKWNQRSIEDPLFVLNCHFHRLNFNPKTIKGFIDFIIASNGDKNSVKSSFCSHAHAKKALLVDNLVKNIERYITNNEHIGVSSVKRKLSEIISKIPLNLTAPVETDNEFQKQRKASAVISKDPWDAILS